MMFTPKKTVDVARRGEPQTDYFGDTIAHTLGDYEPVLVCGWAVTRTQEKTDESHLRTIDRLDVYSSVPVDAGSQIRLPDGSVWEVEGDSEDYNNGPWWQPGLYVVHAIKTEG